MQSELIRSLNATIILYRLLAMLCKVNDIFQ